MSEELKQAAQQALEALEYMHREKCDYMTRNKLGDPLKEDAARLAVPAMEALRRALTAAHPAQAGARGVVLPAGWVPLTIEHEPGYPEEVAFGPQRMMDRLKKWLDKHFVALAAQPAAQATPEPVGEVVYQYQIANGSWIDQTKESHDYNVKRGLATVRVLYTRPAPGVPDVLFDGFAVLKALTPQAERRTSAENVSDVLDAAVRLIRAAQAKGADHG